MAFITVTHGALRYEQAEGISVPHAFTTRLGGVSTGYLSSLNLGNSRGDSRENVLENYRILGNDLGIDPHSFVLSHQTHTDIIRTVTREDRGTGLYGPAFPPCDGLITADPGTALAVFTADCTPVLLHDPVTGAVGAVHAGWRGTALDIAGKAVKAMCDAFGCRPQDIRAAVGPNIGPCCFETDRDVPEALYETYGSGIRDMIVRRGDKFFPDLKAVNAFSLRRAGVKQVEISRDCTACRPDLYWSHRITGNRRGSQGAVILCKEVSL